MNLSLVGNPQINNLLQREAPLSHAYIVAGEPGSGRGLLAKLLAQKALCTSAQEMPCGHCTACKKIEDGIHPDVAVMANEDGKPLSVDQVRWIHTDCIVRPNEGKRKVYVIAQGDMLNNSGQNALLKVLEEPPSYGLFLLITGESGGMLQTIRSRCQTLRLVPVTLEESRTWLQARYPGGTNLQPERLEGYLGRATQIFGESTLSSEKKRQARQEKEENFQRVQGKQPLKAKGKTKGGNEEEANQELVDQEASKMVGILLQGDELSLLQQGISLEKLDKSQVPYFLDQVRFHLIQHRKQGNQVKIDQALTVVEQLSATIPYHVSFVTLMGWFVAEFYQKSTQIPDYQERKEYGGTS